MPDTRKHRGPHPTDAKLFQPETVPMLREAVGDLSWLLTRGYSDTAALKLVGDRLQLTDRQRRAVMRSSCSDQSLARRQDAQVSPDDLSRETLQLDGFNVLTTIEAALAGGVVLHSRDRCYRDIASMHGSYRKVQETCPALEMVGEVLVEFGVTSCRWYLDSPVSNSGRLSQLIRNTATGHGWDWTAELMHNPDPVLAASRAVIASADSEILDKCSRWFNLAREVVDRRIASANIVRLQGNP